jgi:hypothetical protein
VGDGFGGLAAGFLVGLEDVGYRCEFYVRSFGEDSFHDFGYAEEGETVVEKCGDCYFIGGIESAG